MSCSRVSNMKTFALFAAFVLVALFALSEARNRQADTNRSVCRRCRKEPLRPNQRVCAFNGVGTRTFLSQCLMERRACQTGRDITVVSQGPCPRPVRQGGGQQQGGNTDSNESPEDLSLSNEVDDGVNNDMPTIARTTAMPSQPPTSPRTVSGSAGTNGPPPPMSSGTVAPESEASDQPISGTSMAPSGTSMTSRPALSTSVTARQCNSFNSCVPSSAVCGTDGTTYPSQCVLEVTACQNNLDALTVAYAGVCIP
ncbi:uncharacterized protein LOC119738758 isoform X2 [Patiria miniata]|uniref:Kazal-like domain-containing protein n=1 Tax=Patiria miniata TaxID=46514 RepID=A0A914B2B1_PATMI|nr:uncharacterized protein LOC119738758 isoform X2 [Patiria miniata]